MSFILQACEWLYELPVPTQIRESEDAYSLIETVHVLGIVSVLGTIAVLDLRLLGVLLRETPVVRIARPLIRLTWAGFGVMLISGALLFAAQAHNLYYNTAFRLKLVLLALIAMNLLVFHGTVFRQAGQWGETSRSPPQARVAAFLSLLLWSGVVASGRAIAYLHQH